VDAKPHSLTERVSDATVKMRTDRTGYCPGNGHGRFERRDTRRQAERVVGNLEGRCHPLGEG